MQNIEVCHSGIKMMRSQKGFSLIEAMIAMVILSIVGLAILGAVTTAHKTTILVNEKTTAASLARAQMEYIQSQNYAVSGNYTALTIPSEYSGYSYGTPMAANVSTGLQKITITVERGDQPVYTLEDYKVNKGG
jgi:prepilin-type N-terminal cleavage/methylation domain-containing protein